MSASRVFLGLVHYPVYNKNGECVATSVTNLDIHDISRAAATYDLAAYFLIHPHAGQHQMVQELLEFWLAGYGAEYNPDRKEALSRLQLTESVEQAEEQIKEMYGGTVIRVVTDARVFSRSVSYRELRAKIEQESDTSFLLLFGTGYGMTEAIMDSADYILQPISGRGEYNHLSVRSAAAIIIDRLLGPAWWEK